MLLWWCISSPNVLSNNKAAGLWASGWRNGNIRFSFFFKWKHSLMIWGQCWNRKYPKSHWVWWTTYLELSGADAIRYCLSRWLSNNRWCLSNTDEIVLKWNVLKIFKYLYCIYIDSIMERGKILHFYFFEIKYVLSIPWNKVYSYW